MPKKRGGGGGGGAGARDYATAVDKWVRFLYAPNQAGTELLERNAPRSLPKSATKPGVRETLLETCRKAVASKKGIAMDMAVKMVKAAILDRHDTTPPAWLVRYATFLKLPLLPLPLPLPRARSSSFSTLHDRHPSPHAARSFHDDPTFPAKRMAGRSTPCMRWVLPPSKGMWPAASS